MNRRELLAGAALAGWSFTAAARPAETRSPRDLTVVYDSRYADARRFAEVLVARGAVAIDTRANPGWITALRAPANRPGALLAGMTPHSDLVFVRGCAADPGLRLLHEGLHDCRGAARLTHTLRGGQASSLAAALGRSPDNWPVTLAQRLQRADQWHRTAGYARIATRQAPGPDHPGSLASWVVA